MHHRSPRSPRSSSARPQLLGRLLKRLGQLGAVAGAVVVVGTALRDPAPAPPSALVVAAEQDTRAFLDERAAAHLRHLRDH